MEKPSRLVVKKPLFTETVKRFTLWNFAIFLILIIALNIYIISITGFFLNKNLDIRLKHEAENIINTLEIIDDSIRVVDDKEFSEPDFQKVTGHPYFVQIYNLEKNLLIKSANISLFSPLPLRNSDNEKEPQFENLEVKDNSLRAGYFPLLNDKGRKVAYLQIATFKSEYSAILNQIILFNVFTLPAIIIIIIAASFFLAKRSVNPLNKIIETAKNISEKNLSARIEYKASSSDELGRLRDTLNNLFERMENHIKQISQFTDHASHQLINPLTAMKTQLDFILKKDRTTELYTETLLAMKEQTDRMIEVITSLLIIAREDRGFSSEKNLFDVSKQIKEIVESSFNGLNIILDLDEEVYLNGDQDKIRIALENIIDNAIKYSDNKPVNISLKTYNRTALIQVNDLGIGINDKEKEKIFERFYRGETADKLGIKGFGLGLSLAKSIIIQQGGSIKVENNVPNGTKVILSIPLNEI
jgi:signal transduction histidine kinase